MSKSLSSVGGFVLCRGVELTNHLEAREREWTATGTTRIPTLSLIRTFQILKAPRTIARRLQRLRFVSTYVASVLREKGYTISTTPGGPFIALIFDNINRVLEFLRVGRELGLLCCGSAYPACPRGAPRIRLSIAGAHSWEDVEEILGLVDQVAATVRVKGLGLRSRHAMKISEKDEAGAASSGSCTMSGVETVECPRDRNAEILALCPPRSDFAENKDTQQVREAGVVALARYGLGAAGPRWMCGTSSAHMRLEELLNFTVRSCLPPSDRRSRARANISTTLFTDASVGLLSLVSVAMEPLTRQRAREVNGSLYCFLRAQDGKLGKVLRRLHAMAPLLRGGTGTGLGLVRFRHRSE